MRLQVCRKLVEKLYYRVVMQGSAKLQLDTRKNSTQKMSCVAVILQLCGPLKRRCVGGDCCSEYR